MLKIGDKLICKPKGKPETSHCVRATVIKIEDDKVTVSRSLKFGTLPMKNLTLPESELMRYYVPFNETPTNNYPDLKIYEVTITRTGVAFVKTESEQQAISIADHLTTDEISWSDDWFATDATIMDKCDGVVYTDPSY